LAYVSIPKDLTKVRTKFLLGLTKRQTVCFGSAAAIGLPLFFLLRNVASTSVSAFVMVVVMLPWFMFAMYERNGIPLEKYIKYIYTAQFKRPKIRTYRTDNLYAATGRQSQLEKEVERIVSNKERKR
jgi:hypothetical protein